MIITENIKAVIEYILQNEELHYEEDPSENHIYRIAQKAMTELANNSLCNSKPQNYVSIDRVIMVLVDYDELQEISGSPDYGEESTDFWADLNHIEENSLQDFITDAQLKALKNGNADYIAFRLDY